MTQPTYDVNLPRRVRDLYESLAGIAVKFPEAQERAKRAADEFEEQFQSTVDRERMLRIGIIGQVKAGKSSFLNTFLFDGHEVLPKAATPKTANLTIIRHSEEYRAEIEFYTPDDWNRLKDQAHKYDDVLREKKRAAEERQRQREQQKKAKNAAGPGPAQRVQQRPLVREDPTAKAAWEMVDMARRNGLNVDEYLQMGRKTIPFDSLEGMRARLDEYVGDRGKLTPVTKAVRLFVNDPRLENLEIVDTPGLNDPVPARTEKTREALKHTDVAFFLSQTGGSFLDSMDIELLASQLPSEGVTHFELLGTKFDSAILDNFSKESFQEAENDARIRLTETARKAITSYLDIREKSNPKIREKMEGCLPPIFISALAHNLSIKTPEEYDATEKHLFEGFKMQQDIWKDLELTPDVFKRMGNIEPVVERYQHVRQEKDNILREKVQNLGPTAQSKLITLVEELREHAREREELLRRQSLEDLEQQENQLKDRIEGIHAGVAEVMGDIIASTGKNAVDVKNQIRQESGSFGTIQEKTGTKTVKDSYEQSYETGFWFWKKTKYRTVYYDREVTYRYAAVSDAMENIHSYANAAVSGIEGLFNQLIEPSSLRKKLLKVVLAQFEAESETFSPNFFKRVIQEAISRIDLPAVEIDVNSEIEQVANEFSGTVYDDDVDKLKGALGNALQRVLKKIEQVFNVEIKKFQEQLRKNSQELATEMIQSAQGELDTLKSDIANKEQELQAYQTCVSNCDELSSRIKHELG